MFLIESYNAIKGLEKFCSKETHIILLNRNIFQIYGYGSLWCILLRLFGINGIYMPPFLGN